MPEVPNRFNEVRSEPDGENWRDGERRTKSQNVKASSQGSNGAMEQNQISYQQKDGCMKYVKLTSEWLAENRMTQVGKLAPEKLAVLNEALKVAGYTQDARTIAFYQTSLERPVQDMLAALEKANQQPSEC